MVYQAVAQAIYIQKALVAYNFRLQLFGRRKIMGSSVSTGNESLGTRNEGRVIAFHSSSKWKLHFEASKQTSRLIVIDFTASWCGPCQNFVPTIKEFAEIYRDVDFIKIDVDELPDIAKEFKVQTMPTFILMKKGKEIDKVVGAKKEDLMIKIEKYRL